MFYLDFIYNLLAAFFFLSNRCEIKILIIIHHH